MKLSLASNQREHIRLFWNKCGKDNHKWHVSAIGKEETIELLKFMGTIVISVDKQPFRKRANFNKVKYSRHSLKSHKFCFACRGVGQVRHHIIWLKHGGLNSKKNLITLCKPCHAEIHPWLKVSS